MFFQPASWYAVKLLRLYAHELTNIGILALFLFLYNSLHAENHSALDVFGSSDSSAVLLGAGTFCILLLCTSVCFYTLRMYKTHKTTNL